MEFTFLRQAQSTTTFALGADLRNALILDSTSLPTDLHCTMSSESKEIKSPDEEGESLQTVTVGDALEDDDTTVSTSTSQSTSSKSKKKKKSKLKQLLSHKKDAEVALAEVADAISSTTLEEKRSLTKEETAKLEAIIKKMNQLSGGRKDMGDHKFWKTQPVLKFGTSPTSLLLLFFRPVVDGR